jgi:hypothetical protein
LHHCILNRIPSTASKNDRHTTSDEVGLHRWTHRTKGERQYTFNPTHLTHPGKQTAKTKTHPKPPQIIADAKKHNPPSFYLHWMKSLEMTAAFKHSPTHTQVTFRFPVQREYLNPGGTLHGAAQSLFFDVCTTWLLGPIARKPDYWCSFGTSRSLNVVYLRPAREGDVLVLECEVSLCVLFAFFSLFVWELSCWHVNPLY